jgi:hypothetical protein
MMNQNLERLGNTAKWRLFRPTEDWISKTYLLATGGMRRSGISSELERIPLKTRPNNIGRL